MRILILNGSPKGNKLSVTKIHADFLERQFPEHEFSSVEISKEINRIERDEKHFVAITDEMQRADFILWAFPVYLYMIPAQLKRFIELLHERVKPGAFRHLYASSLSTSAMIYDYPAHEYIQAACENLEISYLPGFSFDSTVRREILQKRYQEAFRKGFGNILRTVSERIRPAINFQKPSYSNHQVNLTIPETGTKKEDRLILIITDGKPGSNLDQMTRLMAATTEYRSEIININDLTIKSGCLGCFQCQFTTECVIKDDLPGVYQEKMLLADGIVLAGTLRDHHFTSEFKRFIDRGFFMAQVPKMENKYISFLVSGPLRQCSIARQFMDIFAANRFMINLGYVTDEYTDSEYLKDLIVSHTRSLDFHLAHRIIRPQPFFSRTYHFMMREIIAIMKSVKTAPYKYYVRHGLLDFPDRNPRYVLKGMLYNIVFNLPVVRMRFRKRINTMFAGFFQGLVPEQGQIKR